jgi:hypothetical protein
MSWTGFGVDEDPGPHTFLNFQQFLHGIEDGLLSANVNQLDFLGFDACLMAGMELLPMVAPYAKIYMGSEELEPGSGMHPLTPPFHIPSTEACTHAPRDAALFTVMQASPTTISNVSVP